MEFSFFIEIPLLDTIADAQSERSCLMNISISFVLDSVRLRVIESDLVSLQAIDLDSVELRVIEIERRLLFRSLMYGDVLLYRLLITGRLRRILLRLLDEIPFDGSFLLLPCLF